MYKIITNFKSIVSMTFAVFLLNNANSQIITTIAGTGTGAFSGDGGPSTSAQLFIPYGVASDAAGNLYIADGFNQRIRKINAATGIISTIAGTGTAGYSGDGIAATSAKLNYPNAVCVDGSGNIYVSDVNNSRIRKINASTGLISTIAGIGSSGFSGDGGPATSAAVANTWAVAVDASGNVYVADNGNSRIRKITASRLLQVVDQVCWMVCLQQRLRSVLPVWQLMRPEMYIFLKRERIQSGRSMLPPA
jgi:hypothetical protein